MAPELPKLVLSNGVVFPNLGYGTGGLTDPEVLKKSLEVVIDSGYRHIDTAQIYFNEHIIGEFLEDAINRGKLKREEIFITSKLSLMNHSPEDAEKSIHESLEKLRTDYIDCFLIHGPIPIKPLEGSSIAEIFAKFNAGEGKFDDTPHIETWRVLEKFYKLGVFKAIGISNFNKRQIQELYDQAEIKPMNLQVECHVHLQQHNLHDFCKKLGIVMTSYSTLGNPGRPAHYRKENDPEPLQNPIVQELAHKYKKTPAQIVLRYTMQRGIAVIPKSTNPERIKSNRNVFDFEISADDIDKINCVKKTNRIFDLAILKNHPFYPYNEE